MYTVVDPVPVEEPEPENDDDAWGVIANNGANDNEVLPRQLVRPVPVHSTTFAKHLNRQWASDKMAGHADDHLHIKIFTEYLSSHKTL
jgi:hypothetical protein